VGKIIGFDMKPSQCNRYSLGFPILINDQANNFRKFARIVCWGYLWKKRLPGWMERI